MIELVLGLSLAFIMFSLGLSLSFKDFTVAFRQPKVLLAGLLCQVVLLPVVAFSLIFLFRLQGELAFGVMILGCCPGGITSNVMTRWAKGDVALSISYTAIVSLLTAFTLPFILAAASSQFLSSETFEIDAIPLSFKVFAIATLPVLIGVFLKKIGPSAASFEGRVSQAANLMFAVIVLATLISQWSVFVGNLSLLGPVLLSLNLLMLAIGCFFGSFFKFSKDKITTLAVECGFQNGTVGIVVGTLVSKPVGDAFLTESSLPSAVYGVLMLITIAPFVIWRRSITSCKSGLFNSPSVQLTDASSTVSPSCRP